LTLALDLAREGASAPFSAVDIVFDPEAAGAVLAALAARGGAYQSAGFVDAWARAFGARLAVAVARDEAGETVAALPLHLTRWGPLRVARFAGGGWANYQFGLFRVPADWRGRDVRAFLRRAAKTAGVDLFAFMHCPLETAGAANPLLTLPGTPSPSPALATRLPAAHADWLDAHFSRATQKKLRKKLKKLEAFGEVAFRRAGQTGEGRRFLDALLAHKAAQARARGEPDLFAEAAVRDLLGRLVENAALEMHALTAGERVVAVFGAMASGRRLSGLVLSHDIAEDVAAATPGVQLVAEAARDAIARGFDTLDLGVGDSRYKRETCEIEEPLRDLALGATPLGRLAAPLYLAVRAAMRAIKRRPALYARAMALKYALKPKR
jgi:CelD/BcsL family acetyltransferase involved in cellulose biosynthesis